MRVELPPLHIWKWKTPRDAPRNAAPGSVAQASVDSHRHAAPLTRVLHHELRALAAHDDGRHHGVCAPAAHDDVEQLRRAIEEAALALQRAELRTREP